MTVRRRRAAAAALTLALLAAGCGGSDAEPEPGADAVADPSTQADGQVSEVAPPDDATDEAEAEPAEDAAADDAADDEADDPTASGGGDDPSEAPDDHAGQAEAGPAEDAAAAPVEVDVTLETSDGVTLAGTLHGTNANTTGVVLAHMRGRDRSTWADFASEAAAAGHRVLRFDFRGYGDSPGDRDTALDVDLITAVRFLRDQGVRRVVVIGASMGATAAINVAAQLELAGAVSLSAPADFLGLPALAVVESVAEPLLLITAENDQPYADAALEMAALARATQLQVFAGNAHGTNLFAEHGDTLTPLLLRFLAERLG